MSGETVESPGLATGPASDGPRSVVRSMIEHEDELRNQRLGYLLTLNGLLFTALAFAWSKAKSDALVVAIAVLGMIVGLSGLAAMHISNRAIGRLRRWSDEHTAGRTAETTSTTKTPGVVARGKAWWRAPPSDDDWEMEADAPPVVGLRGEHLSGLVRSLAPWALLPSALAIVWLAVVVIRFA